MRFAITLLILGLATSSLRADVDQEKRIKQILHPDRSLTYYSGDHKVGGMKSFGTSAAQSKGFNLNDKFRPTSYKAEAFKDTKSAWKGDAKFTTKAASTEGARKITNRDKKADVKAAPTKDAPENSKKLPARDDREARYAKRQFLGQESKKLDKNTPQSKENSWKGDLQPMTIDEVRELLNKPKF